MLKGKFAVLSLGVAALLCLQFAAVDTATSGNVDQCLSEATGASGSIFACPASDGDALSAFGLTITVTARNAAGQGIAGIPAADIWLLGCNNLITLCGGSGGINASGPTDANGVTTITGDIAAGGCDVGGVRAVIQGVLIGAGGCGDPCVAVKVKSADQVAPFLQVQSNDLSRFSTNYQPIGGTYADCSDFVAPFGQIQVNDLSKFSGHYSPIFTPPTAHDCF
jgi:hypothetical protein